jgi:WD40 repeat protein
MAFSSDDLLLATASGDQTARIIDMRTQMSKYILQGHITSIKQVRFQPGNDNVIATSSRDGDVNLWDLRCSPSSSVVTELKIPLDPTTAIDMRVSHKVSYAAVHTTISAAHADARALTEIPSNTKVSEVSADSSQTEKTRRSGDVSVTALAFFSTTGREHLLLTGSEASTTVKLWDIRARYSRRGPATPLSTTMEPESHSKHRHFGISTLALSTNNSRLYALSRDNTIYAYSTNHLILGHAPELSPARKPKYTSESRTGLGPIYGFRHPKFHATSFYVKAVLRPTKHDKPELLAVGSSDQCAVVFPTDESLFADLGSDTEHFADSALENWSDTSLPSSSPPLFGSRRPALRRSTSGMSLRMMDKIPIFEVGSALVGGHQKEVTSLTWSFDGDLVSVGDDYLVRRWRENDVEARRLRVEGEGQGRRWGCGWAEVEDDGFDDWDDE